MLRPRKLPPPTAFTFGDKMRLLLSVMMIALGVVLFARVLPLGLNVPALLVCAAFIGFGVYRLGLGYTRWKDYTQSRQTKGN